MKATYTCKLADNSTRPFVSDSSLPIDAIKAGATAAFGESVIDLIAEQLHGHIDEDLNQEESESIA